MDLVFEIGCEELPAGSLQPALSWMTAELEKGLSEGRLSAEGKPAQVKAYATPRRLALVATGLLERAPDLHRTLSGPPVAQAFGPDGKPTKAGEGFAKKAGVPVSELRRDGDRVVVAQHVPGQTATELLPPLLNRIVAGVPFRKSMRWGGETQPFARPVHWIAAALAGEPLPVAYADVRSGTTTRGHRFHAPETFPLPSAADYVAALRERHVLLDWQERKDRIWDEVKRAAAVCGGEPLPDDDLLETVTGLVEEPTGVLGQFEAAFLDLPPEVLVSEMRGHQKYFAVRDAKTQKLLPAFVAVSNTKVADPAVSRRGYERVLRARLADGKFFFDEDRKVKLTSRVERLGRIVFLKGVGTQLDRVRRLESLCAWLHGATGRGDVSALRQAAHLSKADLTTGMVSEFPDLQGVMGRVYALHDGIAPKVADALFEQYLPRGAEERMPASDEGALLALADRLDQLVGFFGVGKEPTGAADPMGLRRAAIGVLRLVLARGMRLDLRAALAAAQALFVEQRQAGSAIEVNPDPALVERVLRFLTGRLEVLWRERAAADSVQAVLHTGATDLVALDKRLSALSAVRQKETAQFEASAATFKRIANILSQASEKKIAPMAFDPAAVSPDATAEQTLAAALLRSRARVQEALGEREDFLGAYGVLAELRPEVDRFFDQVMVMDPNPKLRDNRLALLRGLHELFAPLADFSKLQVERTAATP